MAFCFRGGFLFGFFFHDSFLSSKCAMTKLHIVTLSETEVYKRLMPLSQLGEGLNSWQLLQKEEIKSHQGKKRGPGMKD